jgi:hypothetical protein
VASLVGFIAVSFPNFCPIAYVCMSPPSSDSFPSVLYKKKTAIVSYQSVKKTAIVYYLRCEIMDNNRRPTMLKEHREQRIARLLLQLQDLTMDIAWIEGLIETSQPPAKVHYTMEKRKQNEKLDKVRNELQKLRAIQ